MAISAVNAQLAPGAASLTTLYTVPASTVVTGRIFVTNTSAVATAFRISIAPAGAADAIGQYISYDVAITGNNGFTTKPIIAQATDVIRCYATLATLSFTFSGMART